jgi:hypothetical protein
MTYNDSKADERGGDGEVEITGRTQKEMTERGKT